MNLDVTSWAKPAAFAALFVVGCSSTDATRAASDGGATGDPDPAKPNSNTAGGAAGASEGEAGAGQVAGAAGDAAAQGGAASTSTARGLIDLVQSQIDAEFHYTAQAGFTRFAASQAANGLTCTASTIGDCMVSTCTTVDAVEPPTPTPPAVLDAGVLTIIGAGASKAQLAFGMASPRSSQPGYPSVSGETRFFLGGDSLTLVGAGGADLPAFKAQLVVAPNNVVLTSPDCAAGCPELDRSKNLVVTWTGGGAGSLKATFETVADTGTAAVFCTFPAASGTGTVPKAALALLGDTRDGSTTGIEIFSSANETSFEVADVPTTFSVQTSAAQGLLSVSN
jgi:hypothetical protein